MMKTLNRTLCLFSVGLLALVTFGCGFGSLPENYTGDFTKESGLSIAFDDARGTVELNFLGELIIIELSGMPESEHGCMYMAYATTDSGSHLLGMITMKKEEEHAEGEEEEHAEGEEEEHAEGEEEEHAEGEEEEHAEGEEEEVHYLGELIVFAEDVAELVLNEISKVEIFHECADLNSTKVLYSEFSNEDGSEGGGQEPAGGGGHGAH